MAYVNLNKNEIKAVASVVDELGNFNKASIHLKAPRSAIVNIYTAFKENGSYRVSEKTYKRIKSGLKREIVVDTNSRVKFNQAIQKRIVEVVEMFESVALASEYMRLSIGSIRKYMKNEGKEIKLSNLRKINKAYYFAKSDKFEAYLEKANDIEVEDNGKVLAKSIDTRKLARIDNLKSRQANLKLFKSLEVGKKYKITEYYAQGNRNKIYRTISGVVVAEKPRFYLLKLENGYFESMLKNNLFTNDFKVVQLWN